MLKKFIFLEWKSFLRSASFASDLILKIVMGFFVLYFWGIFLFLGIATFYFLQNVKLDPLQTVNQFLIYYFLVDLMIRLLLQKIPVINIRHLLVLPFKKTTIVHFSLGKTALSFFNLVHAFLFFPFCAVLIYEGYDFASVLCWGIGLLFLVYSNNFLLILLSNKDLLLTFFITTVLILVGCRYYSIFDITHYTFPFFEGMFLAKWIFLIPMLLLIGLYYRSYTFLKSNLYLDVGLTKRNNSAKIEQLTWLDQFGTLGVFLKNDIKLIKRNKRSRTTVGLSILFLLYGLIFFSNNNSHQPPIMQIFAGIFVSGGFLITFGQYVPSWDSAYYQFMMTQNIPYKAYLKSKWWLMVIATLFSAIIASCYLYFGWHVYLTIVGAALYNIGINSHLVLLGGAYNKTPIDLASGQGAFGDKKAFNIKTMLFSLPQLLIPIGLYWLGIRLWDADLGLALVALAGIIGFTWREKSFLWIEKIYKIEKYKTIAAYKQKGNFNLK